MLPTVKSMLGETLTTTGSLLKLVQLLSVQVAVYEVVILGKTTILVPLEALLQTIVPAQPVAVKVAD